MPMFGLLLDLPSVSSTLEQMGAYSKPMFAEVLPYLLPILGIGLIVIVARFITGFIHHKK
jgi:hypothetical protein